MKAVGPLTSNDLVTRVMQGEHVDRVPVALVYEYLGPLQFHRIERSWQLWKQLLDRAQVDRLPVSYEDYLAHEVEIETEVLGDIYRRPAWAMLRRNQTPEQLAGAELHRRGEDLYWINSDGSEHIIAHSLQGEEAKVGSSWSDLWNRGETEEVVAQILEGMGHDAAPIAPAEDEIQAVINSRSYDLGKELAQRYPDALAQYRHGSSPYNSLPYMLGFQALMYAMTELPDKLHKILEKLVPSPSAELLAERQLGVSLMHVEECMASADIISPAMYQQFSFQYDKLALEMYEHLGYRTMLYFSGNLMPFLKYLKELPFTALAFEEDRKNYGIDLAEIRRIIGPDKILFGNLDASFVETCTEEELLTEVRRQINVAGRGNFILSLGSPLTPRTSLDRVRFITEATLGM
jgi:uroporphyrinogen-III decarboxylase